MMSDECHFIDGNGESQTANSDHLVLQLNLMLFNFLGISLSPRVVHLSACPHGSVRLQYEQNTKHYTVQKTRGFNNASR
jgi:hypothetical protein